MRLKALQQELARAGIGAALIVRPVVIGYLTGVFVDPHERFYALYAPAEGEATLFGPALEEERMRGAGIRLCLVRDGEAPGTALRDAGLRSPQSLAVEREAIALAWAADAAGALGQELQQLRDATPMVSRMRAIKAGDEQDSLREAARRLDRATEHARSRLREGVTERQIAREIERHMREDLDVEPGFASIVLFGERSALPHGAPSDRALRPGDLVLVDIGVRYRGYVADTTRTFALGSLDAELRRVHAIVQEAQAASREACRPEVGMGDLDAAARRVIQAAGYGDAFPHRVGHGLGLEAHEEPYLVPGRRDPLRPGMCLTLEPGIYLAGRGGVRIEDDLLVTASGAETLTQYPRGLEVL